MLTLLLLLLQQVKEYSCEFIMWFAMFKVVMALNIGHS